MGHALTSFALVAACALAVLACDRPAAADPAPPLQRSDCCAFPDQDVRDPRGRALAPALGVDALAATPPSPR